MARRTPVLALVVVVLGALLCGSYTYAQDDTAPQEVDCPVPVGTCEAKPDATTSVEHELKLSSDALVVKGELSDIPDEWEESSLVSTVTVALTLIGIKGPILLPVLSGSAAWHAGSKYDPRGTVGTIAVHTPFVRKKLEVDLGRFFVAHGFGGTIDLWKDPSFPNGVAWSGVFTGHRGGDGASLVLVVKGLPQGSADWNIEAVDSSVTRTILQHSETGPSINVVGVRSGLIAPISAECTQSYTGTVKIPEGLGGAHAIEMPAWGTGNCAITDDEKPPATLNMFTQRWGVGQKVVLRDVYIRADLTHDGTSAYNVAGSVKGRLVLPKGEGGAALGVPPDASWATYSASFWATGATGELAATPAEVQWNDESSASLGGAVAFDGGKDVVTLPL